MNGEKPDLTNIRIFGSLCYTHRDKEVRKDKKLDETATRGIFIGYPPHMKGYLVYLPEERRYIISPNVRFVENEKGSSIINLKRKEELPLQEEYTTTRISDRENYTRDIIPSQTQQQAQKTEEPTVHIEDYQPQEEETVTTSKRPTRIRKPPGEYWKANQDLQRRDECRITQIINKNYWEVISSDESEKWLAAVMREIQNLERNDTYEITEIPKDRKLIGWKWVFTKKDTNTEGGKPIYKARLVAQGFSQTYGIDFFETYSPVANLTSVLLNITIAVAKNYKLKYIDVKGAYLMAKLDEEIFMKLPPGIMEDKDSHGKCLRLKKSLYGLKQSGRNWNLRLKEWFRKHECRTCKTDTCIFKKKTETGDDITIIVYVDDLFIIVKTEDQYQKILNDVKDDFTVSEEGDATEYLGANTMKTETGYMMNQQKLIEKGLEKFNMSKCKGLPTPMTLTRPTKEDCPKEESQEQEEMKAIPYRSIIGFLNYIATKTRPNVTFATNILSRYVTNPGKTHWKAAKRVLRYLKDTNYGIKFNKGEDIILKGYTDADWAQDLEDRRSTSGYIFKIGNTPIS